MLLSFMLLAMSLANYLSIEGLYWCIIACVFHGFAQAFGEATIMGYLKGLPSEMVQTFGSGTGLSGFTGVLTVLFLQALGISQGKVSKLFFLTHIFLGIFDPGNPRDPLLPGFFMD
jgi:hypothetical protein